MKKSKGFTLIELLAVIVILAVIALIATPIIIGIIEDSKEKAYENSAYGIIDSAKYYFTTGLLKPENATKYNENIINELSYNGEKPKEGSIVGINKEGQVAVALKYGNNCYIKNFEESKVSRGDKDNCTVDLGSSVVSNTLGSVIQGSPIVTSGSGLYIIGDEYRYRGGCNIQGSVGSYSCNGADPVNNYISIGGQKYRIIAMDSQGVKVQTQGKLSTNMAFDFNNGNRNNADNTFCQGTDSCGVYAAVSGEFVAGNKSGTVTQNSSLYTHLNNSATEVAIANLRNKAKSATWNIGAVTGGVSNVAISTIKSQEARNTASFKMGLINASDYIQASLDTTCQADPLSNSTSSQNCRNNNWLFDPNANYPWTINPWTDTFGNSYSVWLVSTYTGSLGNNNATGAYGVRPVAYLDANTIVTSGTGAESDPWVIQ